MAIKIALCILVGYLCGSVSTGYLIGKLHHVDIRNYGSGNAGATNASRTLGKKAGIIVLLGDLLKVFIPAWLVHYVIFSGEDYATLLCEITGFAGVLGHNYPFWLHFKGGKGVASTGGAMVATDWRVLLYLPGFFFLVWLTGYVSLGSLYILAFYPVYLAITRYGEPYYAAMVITACIFTASGFFTHRANIKRILNGTERKFGQRVTIPADTSDDKEKETCSEK
jgi:glycerol-3-phosphate acyltransferase PlsY